MYLVYSGSLNLYVKQLTELNATPAPHASTTSNKVLQSTLSQGEANCSQFLHSLQISWQQHSEVLYLTKIINMALFGRVA